MDAQRILCYQKKNALRLPQGCWQENIKLQQDLFVIWRNSYSLQGIPPRHETAILPGISFYPGII